MQITRFTGKQIHGHLNLTVPLNKSTTILTGINGTGKTTIIRGINALLNASFVELNRISFSEISVEVEHGKNTVTVKASKTQTTIRLHASGAEPLELPRFTQHENLELGDHTQRAAIFYDEQLALFNENETISRINSIPSPTSLGLDRRPDSLSTISTRTHPRNNPKANRGNPIRASLYKAIDLAEHKYAQNIAAARNLTENLRNDIILAIFKKQPRHYTGFGPEPMTAANDIQRTKNLITAALKDLRIPDQDIEKTIIPFFDYADSVVSKAPRFPSEWVSSIDDTESIENYIEWRNLTPTLATIERFTELIEETQSTIGELSTHTNRYIEAVNSFISESGKSIKFNSLGKLKLTTPGGTPSEGFLALSSGEQQLITVLTFVTFIQSRAAPIIIDEPEISLHIKWQEKFLDSIRSLNPTTQMIIATHSPSIIMDRLSDCIDLSSCIMS